MPKTKLVNKSATKKSTFEDSNKKFRGFLAKQAAQYLAKFKELDESNTQQVSKQRKLNESDDVASSREHRQTHVHRKHFNKNSQSEGTTASVSTKNLIVETSNNTNPCEVLIKTERDLYKTEIKPCIKKEYTTEIETYIKKEYTTEIEPYIKKEYRDEIHTNVKQEVMNDSVDERRNIKREIVISDSENEPVTHIKQEVVVIDSDDEFQVKQERMDKHENKVNVKKEAVYLTNLKRETDVQDESCDMDYEILSISSDSENEFCTYVKQEIVLSDSEDESVIKESLLNEDNAQRNTRKAMINENASQTAAESQIEAVTSKDHPNLQNESIRTGRNKICTTKTKNQTEAVTNKVKPNQNEPTRTHNNNEIDANQTQTRVKADQKLNKTTQLNIRDPNVRKELNTRTLFVGNLPDTVKKIDLQNFFKRYGEIESIEINKKLSNNPLAKYPVIVDGYIRFEKREDALKALEVNGMEYRKRHLKVVIKKNAFEYFPVETIVVKGLPCNTETDDLWSIFESCGVIASITLSRNKRTGEVQGCGYIHFELADSVELALRMKDVKLGEHKLYIRKYYVIKKILNEPLRSTQKHLEQRNEACKNKFNFHYKRKRWNKSY